LVGDPRRLQQVLLNLLSNAVKFTDKGTVGINVKLVHSPARGSMVSFHVTDTGIGIPSEERERIFAPFTQVDATTTRRHSGTGLGLAIASDLAIAMGGSLQVLSEVGKGSDFWFEIPLVSGYKQSEPHQSSQRASGRSAHVSHLTDLPPTKSFRVLLAEDVRVNQQLVVRTLEKRGHVIEVASDGQQALELASKHSYDVILMDVQMPGMDGFQATEAIRKLDAQSQIPIIALTAHAMVGDRQRCLAAGMNDYLAKPLDLVRLVEMVEGYAAGSFAEIGCDTGKS
jgi:CheY-like chemotaxis protein